MSDTKGGYYLDTELKNAVKATDMKAQYDASAKRLLGQKSILAQILVKTVDEFKDMDAKVVAECIEGMPYISTVPIEPGLTVEEKLSIIGTEYEIPIEENMRKDVSAMCNLSEGIEEKGRAEGEAGLILKMHKNGLSPEQIAAATDKTIEEIRAIIYGKEIL